MLEAGTFACRLLEFLYKLAARITILFVLPQSLWAQQASLLDALEGRFEPIFTRTKSSPHWILLRTSLSQLWFSSQPFLKRKVYNFRRKNVMSDRRPLRFRYACL